MNSDGPFPPLTFLDPYWEGEDTLPAWAGLQDRSDPYASAGAREPSSGRVLVSIALPGDAEDESPPSKEQIAAYAHLKAHGAAIARDVLDAVLAYAHALDPAFDVPEDLDLPKLRGMVGLGTVQVLNVAQDGLAYIGFELGCEWDEEHGCGVMTHAGRVVEVGGADTSFLEWIAERDGGTALG